MQARVFALLAVAVLTLNCALCSLVTPRRRLDGKAERMTRP